MTDANKLLLQSLHEGDLRSLAKCITIVENQLADSNEILNGLNINRTTPVIGITGPPGAGKSTLVNSLIQNILSQGTSRIGVLAVDPTSPFTKGSLLGDRLRMSEQFTNPNVYIRSLATRGALGGLSARAFEVIDVMRAAGFDYIFVETVGVGQSEIEIAELADVTVVVFVPESGDEVQTIKSGIVEIANIFVVNKSDRDGADMLVKSLSAMVHERSLGNNKVSVLKTTSTTGEGIPNLLKEIKQVVSDSGPSHPELLYQRTLRLAGSYLLKSHNLEDLKTSLDSASKEPNFNIHRFLSQYFTPGDN